MNLRKRINTALAIMERRYPRSLAHPHGNAAQEIYAVLAGKPYKRPKRIPRKRPNGGDSPLLVVAENRQFVTDEYLLARFGVKL